MNSRRSRNLRRRGRQRLDSLQQVTRYVAEPSGGAPLLSVTQTTTYVNGAQQFQIRWDVQNVSGNAVTFKALAAADFYFDSSDRGTGIYTEGPPRFIGGTNADTGNSGGMIEATGTGLAPWSAYQALEWGPDSNQIWGKVDAAASTAPTFDDTVLGEPVDNAGGVEWDEDATGAGLAAGATRSFALAVRSAVPSALQLTPSNGGAPQGVPIDFQAIVRQYRRESVCRQDSELPDHRGQPPEAAPSRLTRPEAARSSTRAPTPAPTP